MNTDTRITSNTDTTPRRGPELLKTIFIKNLVKKLFNKISIRTLQSKSKNKTKFITTTLSLLPGLLIATPKTNGYLCVKSLI